MHVSVRNVFAAALLLSSCGAPAPDRSVNVLVILADDQRADAIHAWGNEAIRTPSLDQLAAEGFSFRNAHIMGSNQGAVCKPSRAMLMSGRQLFRVYDELDTVATFPERFRSQGYVTFGTGKWHQSQASFARSFSEGREVFFGGMSDHEAVPVRDLNPDGSFTDFVTRGFSTDVFADAALDFLEERARDGAPFLAYVAFTAPHDPRQPPEPWRSEYAGRAVPLPGNFMPLHPFDNGWMTGRAEQLAPWPRPPEMIAEQLGEYYGLISQLDDRIGDILAVLDETGLSDNTLVVYTADNGLALGSHGLLGKQSLYEHSNRVPLIIRGPGILQGESDALVMLYDLASTLHDLTVTEGAPGMDGLSLVPILRGDASHVRATIATVYEDLMRSVREDRFKLIRYPKLGFEQLYDLSSDPLELENLADDPLYAADLARLRELMESEHALLGDPDPLAVDSLWSPVFEYRSVVRSPDGHQPAWIVEKYFGE